MNVVQAILLKVMSALLFAVMATLVRFLSERYPVGQIVFFRSAFAILPVVLIYAWRNELAAAVRTARPLGHVGRGLISIGGMFCNFAALARLPIVDATAISFVAPLITVALSAAFLKERVGILRWSAVIVGFVGVLVMLGPHVDRLVCRRGRHHGRLGVRHRRRVLQFRLDDPDSPPHADRNHLLDRVLFLVDLHARRTGDLAVGLAGADLAGASGARPRRAVRRARPHPAHRELSPRAGLGGGALRLQLDDMGAAARLCLLRRTPFGVRLRRRRDHRGRGADGALARASARPQARARVRGTPRMMAGRRVCTRMLRKWRRDAAAVVSPSAVRTP